MPKVCTPIRALSYDLFCAEEREVLKSAALSAFSRKQPFTSFVNLNVHKNGNKVWLSTSGMPILDEHGELCGYRGSDRDITERKKAEEELLISGEILAHMEEGVYLVRAEDGIIVMANPAIERMLGYAPEELIGKNASIVTAMTGDAEEAVRKNISILNEKGKWQGEILKLRKDGSTFWSYVKVNEFHHPEHGKVWVAVYTDITRQKKFDADKEKLVHDLGERLKELQCMHVISNSIATKESIGEIFQDTVAAIPPGWHYPEITRGKVRYKDKEFVSESFEETEWKQSSDIIVAGKLSGAVEVYYLEERPTLDEGPFMAEERNLIDGIAHTLSETLERRQAEEGMQESRALFDSYVSVAPVGIAVLDVDLKYSKINETLADIHGISIDDHLGKRPSQIIPGALGHEVEKRMQNVLRDHQPTVHEELSGETLSQPGITRWYCGRNYRSQKSRGTTSSVTKGGSSGHIGQRCRPRHQQYALPDISQCPIAFGRCRRW